MKYENELLFSTVVFIHLDGSCSSIQPVELTYNAHLAKYQTICCKVTLLFVLIIFTICVEEFCFLNMQHESS